MVSSTEDSPQDSVFQPVVLTSNLCLFFLFETGSYIRHWPQASCVGEGGFELLTHLPMPSKRWNYRYMPPCSKDFVLLLRLRQGLMQPGLTVNFPYEPTSAQQDCASLPSTCWECVHVHNAFHNKSWIGDHWIQVSKLYLHMTIHRDAPYV